MKDLYHKHQDDIISGEFSRVMMEDWANDDIKLHTWREATGKTAFEQTPAGTMEISEQEYFDNGILMVAMVKAGVELAFETMVEAGIKPESAYYESLHEVPLIANLISRKKLYEMNKVISDTAEYGCYLFDNACRPLLKDFMAGLRDFFGGRSGTYEQVLRDAKDTSLQEMEERARELGANAIVGIDLDYETVGQNGSMLMVTCSGTAVILDSNVSTPPPVR